MSGRKRQSKRSLFGLRPEPSADKAVVVPPAAFDDGSVAAVATGLWRMRNKLVPPGQDRPAPEQRALYRHLESTWDALTGAGVEIQSHDGAIADPGLSLSVVAYQPAPELDRDRVIETVRPTVYLAGRMIQQGEVIVGTALEKSPQEEEPAE